jgi:hypothetical protein
VTAGADHAARGSLRARHARGPHTGSRVLAAAPHTDSRSLTAWHTGSRLLAAPHPALRAGLALQGRGCVAPTRAGAGWSLGRVAEAAA